MFTRDINRWWTVFAGALGCAAGAAIVASYAFGIFIKAISAEFGWDRSETTLGITLFYFASGLGSLTLGSVISRSSVRGPTIAFVSIFSLLIVAIAFLPPSKPVFWTAFALMGFFGAAATALPYAVAIAGWFDRQRGLALALAVSGTAISASMMALYANWLMQNYGWRGGFVGVGIVVGVVPLIGLVFCFRTPPAIEWVERKEAHFSRIVTDRSFWIIGGSIFAISIALLGVITNLGPILTDRGMTMAQAAGVLGVVGASSWVSRVGVGVMLDRIHVRYIAAPIFLLIAAGIALIAMSSGGPSLIFGAILVGLGMGSEADLVTYTVSRYFAGRTLARALGAIWLIWAWAGGLGVFLASLSFDKLGSYSAALSCFVVLALAAGLAMLFLGPYRFVHTEGGA